MKGTVAMRHKEHVPVPAASQASNAVTAGGQLWAPTAVQCHTLCPARAQPVSHHEPRHGTAVSFKMTRMRNPKHSHIKILNLEQGKPFGHAEELGNSTTKMWDKAVRIRKHGLQLVYLRGIH